MKKLVPLILTLFAFVFTYKAEAQNTITSFPTFVGDPAGGWIPIVINGINRKIDASLTGYNRIDSFSIALGSSMDTFYLWKNGAISFYKTYAHNSGGGGGGVSSIGISVPGGFSVSPGTITDNGVFNITTNLTGIVHSSGGAFSGGQIVNADVQNVSFLKLTDIPTTKAGIGLTDVMTYPDTISLSNRIVARVKYSDTSSMLAPYLRKIDTASLSNRFTGKLNLTDTSAMLTPYFRKADTASLSAGVSSKLNKSDTLNMLSTYLRKIDTSTLSNRINNRVIYSDTSNMLSSYLRKSDTVSLNNRIALKMNYTDTVNMLTPYLRRIDTSNMLSVYLREVDTATLSTRINLKLNIIDTTSMLSKYLRKIDTTVMLSPYLRTVTANGLYYPLSSNPLNYYKPTDTSGTLATQFYVSQHGSIYTPGYGLGLTAGAFFVDTSNNKIATQNFVLVHAGTAYSAGSGILLTSTTFKADTALLTTQYDNGLKLNKTDTASMLSPYIRTITGNANYYPRSANPNNYLITIDTTNIPSFFVKTRSLFTVGVGLTYNPATGVFTNSITNTNQLTNGAGFITGINSGAVTTALGYTPVNANGTSNQYITGNGNFVNFMFNNLTDVTVTSPGNNQLMHYNSGTSKWVNFTPVFYQPTDTIATLATKTNIVKDTVLGFQIGDGGINTPSNGTAVYSNPLLQSAQLISVYKDDTILPTFSVTGGGPYVSFNSTTGIITLHNTTFTTSQVVSVQYAFGNGMVAGGGGGGGGSVNSVFARTGSVIAQLADYSSFYYQIPTGTTAQYIRGDGSFSTFPTLATVATTGSYNDLSGRPSIPTNTNQLINGSGFITSITSSNVTAALGYTPLNPSGSSSQYVKGDGTFATSDTTMIPSFFTKVRSEFTAGTGISIATGIITNTINNTNQLTNGAGYITGINSSNVTTALGYTPANAANTITINGTAFDLSTSRSYSLPYSTLSDVTLTSLTDGQLIKWNNGTSRWINFTPTYLSSIDTTNIPNFSVKVRSLFTSGAGISISSGVITNTINNTNQLTNGAGFLSSIDTGNIATFSVKVRSLFAAAGGGLSYSNGTYTTDTTGILATHNYVLTHGSNYIATAGAGILITGVAPTQTYKADTSLLATQYDNGLKVNISDTSTMLSKYLRKSDTTSMLSTYARSISVVKYTDSASMLTPYLRKFDTTTMLTPYARKNFISGAAPIGYSSSTGIISADTSRGTASLATYSQLNTTIDSIKVVPYTTTGITLLRFGNDSLRPKPIIAGTNITFTQNTDSTVTINSSGGGGTLSNNGAGFRLVQPLSSSNYPIRTLIGVGITIDSVTNANSLTLSNTGVTSVSGTSNQIAVTGSTGAITFSLPSVVSITNLTTSGTNTLSGLTNTGTNSKMDVVVQDTTAGILYRRSAQFVDTTGIITGKIVYWNGTNFAVETNTGGAGSVTSVSQTVPSTLLTISGSPVTTSGTLAIGLANFTAHSYLGNNTGSSTTPIQVTNTQLTADLNLFSSSLQGLVPSSGGGTTNFLRADGSWAAPAGGGADSGVIVGIGINKSVSSTTITLKADTSYLVTQGTTQVTTGAKTWGGNAIHSGTLTASSTVSFTGTTYAAPTLTPKLDVIVKDTTTGQLYQRSAQYVDTTGKIDGFVVKWNASAGNFVTGTPWTTTVSGAGTLTLGISTDYVFTGTTTTWTLPTLSGNTGVKYFIKNRGSGNITINSNTGGNDIYNTSAIATLSLTPGQSIILFNDGTFWNVE